MLHDNRWNHGTLSGLITWLEGQPRDTTYHFSDCSDCLIRRYMGEGNPEAWPEEMRAIYAGRDTYHIANDGAPYTYQKALERAYLARAAAPVG